MFFSSSLINWYDRNGRMLIWRKTADPYYIWLSEIILQQTRVAQGLPYYMAFVKAFPSVHDLANASLHSILLLWQGLGYYSRARNMHLTAQYISKDLNGLFPNSLADLQLLKGVGPYTAAAIASFAFNLPVAVVDGNVYRVLARFFAIDSPIDTYSGKKTFNNLAQLVLPKDHQQYNQAIMDFGALVCTPRLPKCDTCYLASRCMALKQNKVDQLPIKTKKIKIVNRYFYYFVMQYKHYYYIKERTENDIWLGLYEFPLLESDQELDLKKIEESDVWTQFNAQKLTILKLSNTVKHKLTHQNLFCKFIFISCENPLEPNFFGYIPVENKQLSNYPFPNVINEYIKFTLLK